MADDLNRKLAEWAGFELHKGPYYETRIASDGQDRWLEETRHTQYWRIGNEAHLELPNFTSSLDACFKWLVPKLNPIENLMLFRFIPTISGKWYCRIERIGGEVLGETHDFVEEPALALCKAIEQLIDKEA